MLNSQSLNSPLCRASIVHISEQNRNNELGKALQARGLAGVGAQRTRVFVRRSREPDVLVIPTSGLAIAIECKYEGAESQLESDATGRLGEQLAPELGGEKIQRAIAVDYPASLSVSGEISDAALKFSVYSGESSDACDRFPHSGWLVGSVNDLAQLIESVAADVPGAAAQSIVLAVDNAAGILNRRTADDSHVQLAIAHLLHQEPGNQANGMAATIVVNACVFHDLAADVAGARRLSQIRRNGEYAQTEMLDAWDTILRHNYLPIFGIARDLIATLDSHIAKSLLGATASVGEALAGHSMVTVGDLTGQVFGKLIVDREYLAANYTLPTSAALLANVAVSRMDVCWADKDAVKRIKIADLACGTGALLSAAYGQIRSQIRLAAWMTAICIAISSKTH